MPTGPQRKKRKVDPAEDIVLEPNDDLGRAGPAAIGVDPLYSDCAIRATSGTLYYTSRAVMVTCSPVFRGLIDCCAPKTPMDKGGKRRGPAVAGHESSGTTVMEIPLDDPEEQIATLVEHLHQPERFLASVVPVITLEGAASILRLTQIAFKYDMQGNCPA
jgi:hypothetical protein